MCEFWDALGRIAPAPHLGPPAAPKHLTPLPISPSAIIFTAYKWPRDNFDDPGGR